MARPTDRDLLVRFEDACRRYSQIPRVKQVKPKSPGDLVDQIVSDRQYHQPERSYRELLIELLQEDEELREIYNS
jgi:hypothetical protein